MASDTWLVGVPCALLWPVRGRGDPGPGLSTPAEGDRSDPESPGDLGMAVDDRRAVRGAVFFDGEVNGPEVASPRSLVLAGVGAPGLRPAAPSGLRRFE
mmetsp:Transcript_12166/g.35243  ORF Transcript_12166/g.35243 Transcript_12166/m.35243 type:complete len:99 (-) Transcript_12166:112-408(-)